MKFAIIKSFTKLIGGEIGVQVFLHKRAVEDTGCAASDCLRSSAANEERAMLNFFETKSNT
eukprot:445520-Prorocentrum_lima.AAC.1